MSRKISLRTLLVSILFSLLVFALFTFLTSCEEENEPLQVPFINIQDSSLSQSILSATADSVTFNVNWGYTSWKPVAGDTVEGSALITRVVSNFDGNMDRNDATNQVTVYYSSNESYFYKKQYVLVKSLTDNIADTLLLMQYPKELVLPKITLIPTTTYQTITGFGGANAIWGSDYLSKTEMNLAFKNDSTGLGLNILRVRLSSDKNDWAGLVSTIQYANSLGVTVLATPWSPPAEFKSNASTNGGGYLLEANYADFIAYINEFIAYMNSKGATIDVVSLQNEPDYQVSYEGCEYTATQMYNLVKNYAGAITGAKVMAAESFNFKQSYTDPILNDADARENLDMVGGHIYGSGNAAYPLAQTYGKQVWMTEHLLNLDSGNNPDNWNLSTSIVTIWNESLQMVDEIQQGLRNNWNAYIWWYIRRYYSFLGDGTKGTTQYTILKRGYAMAHFSKFIRPGYKRILTSLENGPATIKNTAFKSDQGYVLVLSNTSTEKYGDIEIVMPASTSSATAYASTVTKTLEETRLTPTDDKVKITLPAKSVVTVVLE